MSTPARKIRVLIVDDSAIVRRILTDTLKGEPDLEVVAAVPDPIAARQSIAALHPDVITLDIEMPIMDGITFLRELMATTPIPAIIISSVAQAGCDRAMQALEAGAVEVVAKPGGPFSVSDLRLLLPQQVRAAANAKVQLRSGPTPAAGPPGATPAPLQSPSTVSPPWRRTLTRSTAVRGSGSATLVAIGASTGGTEAVKEVLTQLPSDFPPVLVVQHIPAGFSNSFAKRLNALSPLDVREASDGDKVLPGTVLIAPGDRHMVLQRIAGQFSVRLDSGPRVCYQRPSVDVLFNSVAALCGPAAVGVILTGMGNDGAEGLLHMREAGARTIGQDESSCVVYGMPKEAARCGAVETVLPLSRIADGILRLVRTPSTPVAAGRAS
ncbi:MAG TPA: chemotaxis response regulator protein-glutamate methylesterase [Bryobacteraceae bacterium]|nr:chemotaxis response regulator protein-glutamate methylesterase [Bryobacteraceae bacterium]